MRHYCLWPFILFSIGIVGGGWFYYNKKNAKNEWLIDRVDEGNIRQSISATGSLGALITVEVGCQISGIIASISADFNDSVKEGQLIAQIDPSTFEAQVQQASANLENSKAGERNVAAQIQNLKGNLLTAKADQKVTEANLKKSQVALEDALRNLKRMSELFSKKLISTSEKDSAQSGADSAKAAVEASNAQIEASKAK
ncbi:biotin/lipoyl-binding protein, partial [bacterium]|nr:biotin/lipoyl-binding protein [bacterium]